MSTKKIRVLVPFPSPFLFGVERTILETFDVLRPEVEPHFLLSHSALRRNLPILSIMKEKGFSYSFLSDIADWPVLGKPKSLKHFWNMIRTTLKFNADVLRYARNMDALSLANPSAIYQTILTCILFRLQKKQVIFTFHELMIPWTHYNFALRLVSPFVSIFRHNTLYSFDETTKVNSFLKKYQNDIVPPVVLVRPNSLNDCALAAFEGKSNIVFIGQVSPHKGADILIEAFEEITAVNEDVVLHIVGGCNESYEDEFRRRINLMQSQRRIIYWGFRNDVSHFLKMATIFVQPTRPSICHESFGRGVVEAMAMGVPSVCFRSGALQELVVHEETGLICEKESAKCLAENLQRLLEDQAFRSQCGENAYQRYKQQFSPHVTKQKWLDLFDI